MLQREGKGFNHRPEKSAQYGREQVTTVELMQQKAKHRGFFGVTDGFTALAADRQATLNWKVPDDRLPKP